MYYREQCRLAVKMTVKLQKTRQYRADGDSSALLRPHWQASGAMFTAHIAQMSSGEVCLEDELSLITWRGINTLAASRLALPFGVSLISFAPIYAYIKSRCSRSDFREIRAILHEKH
jgi:hypothetical protein